MCVISEINGPSKEVKFRFMRKSEQYFLLSKKLEKWFPESAILHRYSIQSIDNRTCYSFDAIDKGTCDNIKTKIVVKDDVSTPWCMEINQRSYLKL